MATYSRRERVTRYVEWTVPADLAWGACWNQVSNALDAALDEYRRHHGLDEHATPADNEIRFFPGDEEIVIRFEVKEQSDG